MSYDKCAKFLGEPLILRQCETKSKLYFQSAAETDSELKNWLRRQRDRFKEEGVSRLRTMCQEDEFYVGTPPVEALKRKHWRIVADYIATSAEICTQLDALELTSATPDRKPLFYRPLRFVPREKLTGADKLPLAFNALSILTIIGKTHKPAKSSMGANTERRDSALEIDWEGADYRQNQSGTGRHIFFSFLALHFEVGKRKSPAKPLQDSIALKENAANCRRPV